MTDPVDLVREALQVHVNECSELGDGWLIAHHVTIAGLCRFREDGSLETQVIVVSPLDQAGYITSGLLGEAPCAMLADCEEEEADDETG